MKEKYTPPKDITEIIRRVFKLKDDLLKLRLSFADDLGQDKRFKEDQEFIKKWLKIKEDNSKKAKN